MNFHLSDLSFSNGIEHEETHPFNENSVSELTYTIKTIADWMDFYLKENLYNYNHLHFYLFPVGSITYHKSYPDNSKDFLLCFPGIIKLNRIHDSLVPYLNRTGKFQLITILLSKLVPVLQLVRSNCTFEILICFLPSPYCLSRKPTFDLRNPPRSMLEQMDLKSILALNSLRNCLLIRDYLNKSFALYQETLFQLNGTALAIMLACVFRKASTPLTSVLGSLFAFFRHFVELNFSNRSISLNLADFRDNMRQIVMENPDFMIPKNGAITVLTPAMPHQNCTRHINKLVLDRIIGQFKEALSILDKCASSSCSSSKLALQSALMQPATLVDFIRYAQKVIDNVIVDGAAVQIVLISVIEEESMEDRAVFNEFVELIEMRLKRGARRETLLHYPVAISNVVLVDGELRRVRRFIVCDYGRDRTRWTLPSGAQSVVGDNEVPNGISCTAEPISDDDSRIVLMNFDSVEKIVRLIYSDI